MRYFEKHKDEEAVSPELKRITAQLRKKNMDTTPEKQTNACTCSKQKVSESSKVQKHRNVLFTQQILDVLTVARC